MPANGSEIYAEACVVHVEYLDNYDKAWGHLSTNTIYDAGYDLRACCDALLEPGEYALIPLGIKTSFSKGYEAQLRARSGLALKHGIGLVNGVGTIDAGYRGEWGALVINNGKEPFYINKGDRVCQVVFNKLPGIIMVTAEHVEADADRGGGFGSSGVK